MRAIANELYGQMLVAMALARAGLKDSARAVAAAFARAMRTIDPTRESGPGSNHWCGSCLEDKDEALRLLSTYLATNPQQQSDKDETWWFRDLQDDPRYVSLVGPPSTKP